MSDELIESELRRALDAAAWAEVDRLAQLLDERDAVRAARVVSLRSAALWYAEQGLRVFPVQPRAKVPFPRSRGCHDATSELAQVARWWGAAPDANIGIATGHLVDVIDVDGLAGNIALARDVLDETPRRGLPHVLGAVSTPRAGGRHLYVAATGDGNHAGICGSSVDYRGRGGYVIAPPSVTDAGVYRWTRALDVAAL